MYISRYVYVIKARRDGQASGVGRVGGECSVREGRCLDGGGRAESREYGEQSN